MRPGGGSPLSVGGHRPLWGRGAGSVGSGRGPRGPVGRLRRRPGAHRRPVGIILWSVARTHARFFVPTGFSVPPATAAVAVVVASKKLDLREKRCRPRGSEG